MSHEGYHEDGLSEPTKDLHRALVSLEEELEAVDWYQQRVDASADESLKAVLLHNRNEEVEHAMMTLEWIRRRDPVFDEAMRTYLFTTAPITEIEEEVDGGGGTGDKDGGAKPAGGNGAATSLGIGSLKKVGR
jgi:uncharacterized protein